jgi:protein-tyrosine-phosphatase
MAAAIARYQCRLHEEAVSFKSAGILARTGALITTEAGMALEEKGISFSHKSQRVTKEILSQADFVFAMEQQHIDAVNELVREISPSERPEIELVVKYGGVPDPLGHPLHTYRNLANFLIENIPERMVETGLIGNRSCCQKKPP